MNTWVSAAPGVYFRMVHKADDPPHGSRAVGMVKRPRNRAACSEVSERREDERPAGPPSQAPFVWSKWEVATVPATPYAFGVAVRTFSKLDLAASQVVGS